MSQQQSSQLAKTFEEFRNYLVTDKGKYHLSYLKEKEPKETRELLEKLKTLPIGSPEFVDYVLYGLLPNKKTRYSKRVSLSPSFLNIKKFFGRFNYTEDDWKQLAELIFNLVIRFERDPDHLDDFIREFISHRLSKALQCGSISPIFFALNPRFPIINNREIRVYKELSFAVQGQADKLSRRLENYLADISKIRTLVEALESKYGFAELEDYAIFDLFCYWFDENAKGSKTSSKQKTVTIPVPQGPAIEDQQIANFIQALACSPPQAYFIGMTDGPLNLHKLNTNGRIVYNTEFQRGEVWDKHRKQKLIDSILRGYSINTVYFRQLPDGRFECLDGQQRLKTINEFLKDEFPINPDFTPEFKRKAKFSELPDSLKNKITSYAVYVITFYTDKDDETCKIFLRLQEGLALNSPEKLNAMIGELRDLIVTLAQHPFIKELGIDDYRFAHRYIVAQIFLLTQRNRLTDSKFRQLEEMYTTYKAMKPSESVTNTVTKVLNLLKKEFGVDAKVIKYNADFATLFWLGKHLVENYAVSGVNLGLKDFFIQFASKVGQVENGEGENAPYYEYQTSRRSSADSRTSMEKRFNIILAKFLVHNQKLQPKDPVRDYDYSEKLAIFARDKETCQICGKITPFDKGTVDHKIPHSKGGFTTIENGQWACIPCNLKKLAKMPD
jgi:hypothetical protein